MTISPMVLDLLERLLAAPGHEAAVTTEWGARGGKPHWDGASSAAACLLIQHGVVEYAAQPSTRRVALDDGHLYVTTYRVRIAPGREHEARRLASGPVGAGG